MHAQLRNPTVDRTNTRSSTEHGSDRASTPRIITDLEDLEFGVLLADANVLFHTTMEEGSGDGVGSHVSVRVSRYSWADVETWRVVFEVGVEEVGIDGVDDVAADEERVGIGARHNAAGILVGELVYDALDDCGKEVASGSLAEERADFLVVEQSYHLDLGGVCGRCIEQRLNSGPRAELVINTTRKDELLAKTTKLCRLDVEEFKLPVDDARICPILVELFSIIRISDLTHSR
jgi:hypothetical protein